MPSFKRMHLEAKYRLLSAAIAWLLKNYYICDTDFQDHTVSSRNAALTWKVELGRHVANCSRYVILKLKA
jgi:hypothetical protein